MAEEKTYTQAEVDAIVTQTKLQAINSTKRQLMALGLPSAASFKGEPIDRLKLNSPSSL